MSTAYEQLLVEKVIDFGDSFSDVKQPNNVITSLNLFGDENLSINKVLNDRLVEDADRVNSENSPYVNSDFNTTELPTFDSHFVELRTFKRVDKISSRSFEQARGFGKTVAETMDDQIAKYLIEHDIAYQNTLETILAESVLAGKQSGVYTAQGDLNYFSEFNQTKSTATFDFSTTANVLAQLDAVQRQIRQAARSKLKSMQGIVCLCAGDMAQNLAYHKSILDAVIYATPVNDPANFVGTLQFYLQAYPVWSLKGITFVDVTGDSYLESLIGENNAVFVPRFAQDSGVFKLFNGIGTMHATLGKTPAKFHQYAIVDEMQFPTLISESAHLAINNLPQAVVYASISG